MISPPPSISIIAPDIPTFPRPVGGVGSDTFPFAKITLSLNDVWPAQNVIQGHSDSRQTLPLPVVAAPSERPMPLAAHFMQSRELPRVMTGQPPRQFSV